MLSQRSCTQKVRRDAAHTPRATPATCHPFRPAEPADYYAGSTRPARPETTNAPPAAADGANVRRGVDQALSDSSADSSVASASGASVSSAASGASVSSTSVSSTSVSSATGSSAGAAGAAGAALGAFGE